MNTTVNEAAVLARVRHWLERAVIGLNLCPFAKAVHVKNQIRYVVISSDSEPQVLSQLQAEMQYLLNADPNEVDTTILVLANALGDFLEYNDFLDSADEALERAGLLGVLQIASFHPDYQFAGTAPDDMENYTNRAPYPLLQLLREESLDTAIEGFPDTESIYERNQETLRRLGLDGWRKLMSEPAADS